MPKHRRQSRSTLEMNSLDRRFQYASQPVTDLQLVEALLRGTERSSRSGREERHPRDGAQITVTTCRKR